MKTMRTVLMVIGACLLGAVAMAQGLDEVKGRMDRRLTDVNELKRGKLVGENNEGYLAFVGNERPKANVVDEENADRRQVYEAIAAKSGANVAQVGKQRAKQIADNSASGIMLQDANGNWYEKK